MKTAPPTAARATLQRAKTVVVKVGSRTLANSPAFYTRMGAEICALQARGVRVVLVSSGAIALGTKKLGYKRRPTEMPKLQAAAAAGQSLLMRAWEEAFERAGGKVAQVLLSHADLSDRARANNARDALRALLDADCTPILNENDSVAVEEIKFGDNDQLASLVAPLVDADVLVLLSDVDGLLDEAGGRVPVVNDIESEARPLLRDGKSAEGTGGMQTKLEAAERTTRYGASTVLANANAEGVLTQLLAGRDVGTLFVPAARRMPAKHHWIAFTLRPTGDVVLDEGCARAVHAGKSVLAVGVLGVRGAWDAGDAVCLVGPDGSELGRALCKCSSVELARAAFARSHDVVVHRSDTVIWARTSAV